MDKGERARKECRIPWVSVMWDESQVKERGRMARGGLGKGRVKRREEKNEEGDSAAGARKREEKVKEKSIKRGEAHEKNGEKNHNCINMVSTRPERGEMGRVNRETVERGDLGTVGIN